jgi:hypothetical protein
MQGDEYAGEPTDTVSVTREFTAIALTGFGCRAQMLAAPKDFPMVLLVRWARWIHHQLGTHSRTHDTRTAGELPTVRMPKRHPVLHLDPPDRYTGDADAAGPGGLAEI